MATKECDLLIIGGGPAGLSAAIHGASEGLKVVIMDSGTQFGGQAAKSSLIENYPGFPAGIPGGDLLGYFAQQAQKFRAEMLCPEKATSLRAEGAKRIVMTDDEDEYIAKMVILGIGLSYKRLGAVGLGSFMGRGVLYGTPTVPPDQLGECTISIVGGANSAGQAALNWALNKKAKIKVLVRKKIGDQMSQYLIDRIQGTANIEVIEGVEVTEVHGNSCLEKVTLKQGDGSTSMLDTRHLFIFIGAAPKTLWLNGTVVMDPKKFVLTGPKLVEGGNWKTEGRLPLQFETSMPGVFACGDVRFGSVKRLVTAVGEGTATLQMCHEYLRLTNGK